MNWALATSLNELWRSPDFSMWVALAAAGFFGLVVLITLLRADKSLANGALTIIALMSVGFAVATIIGGNGPVGRNSPAETHSGPAQGTSLPALACVDDLAGDTVLSACEKALFGSAETAAAAVSYAAAQLERLTTYGDAAAVSRNLTPDLAALRRAVERDRYGLVAHVLVENYGCTPSDCPAFRLFTNRRQVVSNMEARSFDGVITRYAASWNTPTPAPAAPAGPAVAIFGTSAATPPGPTAPTGKPTNAEFPTAASTPPVSIMNPEPGTAPAAPPRSAPAAAAASPSAAPAAPPPPAKKPPAPKVVRTPTASAPMPLSPATVPPAAVARE